MFEQLGLIGNIVVLAAALLALTRASGIAISNSVSVADVSGLGKTNVGFILVAFSTSLPELFIAVFAVLEPGTVGVSIGNVLGSNIVNVCLVLGICFLLIGLRYRKNSRVIPEMAKDDLGSLHFGLLVASIVPLVLLYIGYASRYIGLILLAIFVYYMYRLSKVRTPTEQAPENVLKAKLWRYTALSILGAAGVVACSFLIVDSASFLAASAGIPNVVIGATIVAFGTSVPELATSLDSIKRGHVDLALGNVIGSCFINITGILGVTLLAATFAINVDAFSKIAIFSLIANLFLGYFLTSKRIGRLEGSVLLFLYAVFLAISFSMTGLRS